MANNQEEITEELRQRGDYRPKSSPKLGPSKVDAGSLVWFKKSRNQRIPMVVVEKKSESGAYLYKIKDQGQNEEDKSLYNNGEWVKEANLMPDLSRFEIGLPVSSEASGGPRVRMTIATKKINEDDISYQIKDAEGKLFGDGEWMSQSSLTPIDY